MLRCTVMCLNMTNSALACPPALTVIFVEWNVFGLSTAISKVVYTVDWMVQRGWLLSLARPSPTRLALMPWTLYRARVCFSLELCAGRAQYSLTITACVWAAADQLHGEKRYEWELSYLRQRDIWSNRRHLILIFTNFSHMRLKNQGHYLIVTCILSDYLF